MPQISTKLRLYSSYLNHMNKKILIVATSFPVWLDQ